MPATISEHGLYSGRCPLRCSSRSKAHALTPCLLRLLSAKARLPSKEAVRHLLLRTCPPRCRRVIAAGMASAPRPHNRLCSVCWRFKHASVQVRLPPVEVTRLTVWNRGQDTPMWLHAGVSFLSGFVRLGTLCSCSVTWPRSLLSCRTVGLCLARRKVSRDPLCYWSLVRSQCHS